MAEFLPGVWPEILEEADVLDAWIVLQVHDALGGQSQELPDLVVAGLPEMPVVPGIFHQNFMSADGTHAIIDAVATAVGLAFNVVQRRGMHHRARGPTRSVRH